MVQKLDLKKKNSCKVSNEIVFKIEISFKEKKYQIFKGFFLYIIWMIRSIRIMIKDYFIIVLQERDET